MMNMTWASILWYRRQTEIKAVNTGVGETLRWQIHSIEAGLGGELSVGESEKMGQTHTGDRPYEWRQN